MDVSHQYRTTFEGDKYKLPFLWGLCNIIFPEIVHLADLVTLDNFRGGIPLTMIGLQLSNLLYFKLSSKIFYTTIALNVVSLVAFGSFTLFRALPEIPFILDSYYKLFLQNSGV